MASDAHIPGADDALYRRLFARAPESFALAELRFDARGHAVDWVILDVNDAYLASLGVARDEIVGRHAREFIPPEELAKFLPRFARVVATGAPDLYEVYVKPADRFMRLETFPADGARFAVLFTDITAHKRAEEALRESEANLRRAEAMAQVGHWEWHTRTDVGRWSEGAFRIFGLPPRPVITLADFLATIHPDDRAVEERVIAAAVRERRPFTSEYRILRPDGAERLLHCEAEVEVDAAGEPEKLFGILQDITAHKETEAERERLLAESEQRAAELDAIIASAADGITIYGPHSEITRMNAAAERLFGYTPEERTIPLTEWLPIVQPQTTGGQPMPLEALPPWRAMRGETVQGVIMVLRQRDGRQCWVSVSAAPLRDEHGGITGAVITLTDITPLHELQQEREIFMHTVSHDLRNPLSVIHGHARLLEGMLEAQALDGQMRPSVEAILRGAGRITVMLEDLVDAARLEGGEVVLRRAPVALDDFLVDLLQRSETMLDVSRLQLELPAELPPVSADPARLERILLNLLTNALKYSPEEAPVRVTARRAGDMVEVAVADRGAGIAPEDLPHIFDRFYRAKGERKAESIGLGLYISRKLVEAHGGRIRAISTPGRGSVFTVCLPVA